MLVFYSFGEEEFQIFAKMVAWALVYLVCKFEHEELLGVGRGGTGVPGDEGYLVSAYDSIVFGKSAKKGDATPSSHGI
jgi:hypothetical protein